MLRLKYKVRYAIDIGNDFILRNINNDDVLGIKNLNKYFLGILSLSENFNDFSNGNFKTALRKILSKSQKRDNLFFILNDDKKDTTLTAIASLIFYNIGSKDIFLNFCNSLLSLDVDSSVGLMAFYFAYYDEKDSIYLEKCAEVLNKILKNKEHDYLQMKSLLLLKNIIKDTRIEKLIRAIREIDNLSLVSLDNSFIIDKKYLPHIDEILSSQVGPSNFLLAGSFCDGNGVPQLDISHKNIGTLKNILNKLENKV